MYCSFAEFLRGVIVSLLLALVLLLTLPGAEAAPHHLPDGLTRGWLVPATAGP